MTPQEQVVQVAESELGYHEKATFDNLDDPKANSGSNNYVKYSRDLEDTGLLNGRKRGIAWCSIFVIWTFYRTFGKAQAKKLLYLPNRSGAAGCNTAFGYYKWNDAALPPTDIPSIGDVVFFSSNGVEATHTGIVSRVTDDRFYTIEGNSDDEVKAHYYKFGNQKIFGFGRPDWAVLGTPEEEPEMDQTYITVAEKGNTVNMRKKPFSTAPIVARIPLGTPVTVIGRNEDAVESWATVMYKSSVGYIKDEFLIPLYTTDNDEEVTPEDEIVTLPPLDIPQSTYELLRAWIDNATVG